MKGRIGLSLLGILLLTGVAAAQTTATPQPTTTQSATTTSPTGAFDKLWPGNQKIARALFEAQKTGSTSEATKMLTLDEIAAMKQDKGWGEVFKEMKAKGLVTEKNLGQVVSNYNRRHGLSERATGRSHGDEGKDVTDDKGPKGPGRGPSGGGGGHGGGRGK